VLPVCRALRVCAEQILGRKTGTELPPIMGADLGVRNTSPDGVKSVHKKLEDLYSRRPAVESFIRCPESYAACQAKNGTRVRLNGA
jgi:hypothetical protein